MCLCLSFNHRLLLGVHITVGKNLIHRSFIFRTAWCRARQSDRRLWASLRVLGRFSESTSMFPASNRDVALLLFLHFGFFHRRIYFRGISISAHSWWLHYTLTAVQSVLLRENTNLFQCYWYMRELSEHNGNFTLAYAWFLLQEMLGEHRKMHPAELNHRKNPWAVYRYTPQTSSRDRRQLLCYETPPSRCACSKRWFHSREKRHTQSAVHLWKLNAWMSVSG